ncbi:hypothetical protein C8Q75DRAFT_806216 [Abortiporus biennis]|nr:hypothetical protein C8Q75DRAFT_806216 [Abortiporus biennis]
MPASSTADLPPLPPELQSLSPLSHITPLENSGFQTLRDLREATDSPTPLTEFLQDPFTLRTLIHHKKSRRGSASGSRERSASKDLARKREKGKDSDTTSLLTVVLAEEERQANHLKVLLRSASERLENEMRRAELAERRAFTAESHSREAATRLSNAENARHQAELDSAHSREEIARHKTLAESKDRELRKAQAEIQKLDRTKNDLEHSLSEAKESARNAKQTLREWQAREDGVEEGRRLEIIRRYNDGREDGYEDGRGEGYETGRNEGYEEGHSVGYEQGRNEGYNAGRLAGFEEGKNIGWSEGYEEGLEQGRKEEREQALRAFDKFMDSEFEKPSRTFSGSSSSAASSYSYYDDERDRTNDWTDDSPRHKDRFSQRGRGPSPPPLHVPSRQDARGDSRSPRPLPVRPIDTQSPERGQSPQPVPWLHRRLNSSQAVRTATPPNAPQFVAPVPPPPEPTRL